MEDCWPVLDFEGLGFMLKVHKTFYSYPMTDTDPSKPRRIGDTSPLLHLIYFISIRIALTSSPPPPRPSSELFQSDTQAVLLL